MCLAQLLIGECTTGIANLSALCKGHGTPMTVDILAWAEAVVGDEPDLLAWAKVIQPHQRSIYGQEIYMGGGQLADRRATYQSNYTTGQMSQRDQEEISKSPLGNDLKRLFEHWFGHFPYNAPWCYAYPVFYPVRARAYGMDGSLSSSRYEPRSC